MDYLSFILCVVCLEIVNVGRDIYIYKTVYWFLIFRDGANLSAKRPIGSRNRDFVDHAITWTPKFDEFLYGR